MSHVAHPPDGYTHRLCPHESIFADNCLECLRPMFYALVRNVGIDATDVWTDVGPSTSATEKISQHRNTNTMGAAEGVGD